MLNLLRQSLQTGLTLRASFSRWNQIAQALREPPRRRNVQSQTWAQNLRILS